MKDYPAPWQRKMMWAALTACFVVVLVVVVAAVIWAGATIISFLQPILIPVAIAAILTYLLDPLVTKMSRGTLSRTKAIVLLFAIAFFALGGLTASGRPSLRATDCGKPCWVTSDDSNCLDFCLGLDHWQSHRSAPCCAAYCHAQGAFRALCLGSAFAGTSSADRKDSRG